MVEEMDFTVINDMGTVDDDAVADIPGLEPEQPNQNIISEEMAALIIKTPFSVASGFWGDYWELTETELSLMAPSASKVFSDLFGKYVDTNPDAYMLGFSLITCIASRAAKMAMDKNQKPNQKNSPSPIVEEGE